MSAVAERYSRAITSSNLEWKREPTAVDTITAAGMNRESLGIALLRIRSEYDAIAGTPLQIFMRARLRSVVVVRDTLAALVLNKAHYCNARPTKDDATEIAAKLLDQWLEPNCPVCDGTGSTGQFGKTQTICNPCSGSRRRAMYWPQAHEEIASIVSREIQERIEKALRRLSKRSR